MIKVCMFVWNNLNNDARVLNELKALSEEGYKASIICLEDSKSNIGFDHDLNEQFGINVYRVKGLPTFYNNLKKRAKKTQLIRLLELIFIPMIMLRMIIVGKRTKSDIFHSNDINTLIQGYICSKITYNQKVLIYDSHEIQIMCTNFYKGKKVYLLEKFLIKKVDEIIMTTNLRADKFCEIYKIKKPHIIHNYPQAIDIESIKTIDLHQKLNISKEEPILLYQGGLQDGRGLEKLIIAAKSFIAGKLVFIGGGPLKSYLIDLVEKNGLKNRVIFIDTVPYSELFSYTRNAYLGFQVLENTCFNHYSTLSNKLFEYIMMGIPVIASNFPEIRNVVETNCVGTLINPDNVDTIVKAVNNLINDPERRDEYSKNCLRAREKYNWAQEKKILIGIYNRHVK